MVCAVPPSAKVRGGSYHLIEDLILKSVMRVSVTPLATLAQ